MMPTHALPTVLATVAYGPIIGFLSHIIPEIGIPKRSHPSPALQKQQISERKTRCDRTWRSSLGLHSSHLSRELLFPLNPLQHGTSLVYMKLCNLFQGSLGASVCEQGDAALSQVIPGWFDFIPFAPKWANQINLPATQ